MHTVIKTGLLLGRKTVEAELSSNKNTSFRVVSSCQPARYAAPVHNGYLLNDSASILRVGVNYKF
jgi:hypothetical protein